MIASAASFTPALAGLAGRSLTSLRMGGAGEYKPWDVKQEGGQMDAGWGTGKFTLKMKISFSLICRFIFLFTTMFSHIM
jgi:hypothetical protein